MSAAESPSPTIGPLGIPRRLAGITAVVAVLLVAGATELSHSLSEAARLGDLEVESVDLATTLADYLTRISPTGEPTALAVGLGGWSRRHITETDAIVFLASDSGLTPAAASDSLISPVPSDLDAQVLLEGAPAAWFAPGPKDALEVAAPLGGRRVYGVLHVRVSTGRLAEWARLERRRALLLALGSALLVALAVALLTTRWVGRPLRSLIGAMAGAHGGAGSAPVAPEIGPPEFRLLARRYNDLRGALAERERESQSRAALLALEERARNLDRLAQAEEITAGFAHEIGTPLSTMNGHLQLLREDLRRAGDGAGVERVELMLAQVDRAAKIVRDRLARGGWPEPAGRPTDLHRRAERMLLFLQPTLEKTGVHAVLDSPGPGPMARTDGDLVEQILLNLLKNAIEALPPGGRVTLRTGIEDGLACLEVTDDGPGLPPEARAQLFQPFVTSKGPGGTGLGLAVSRRLARALGGELALAPSQRGTRWRLTLPLAAES